MLISPELLQVYGVNLSEREPAVIEQLIRSASSAITDAAGAPILRRTSTVVVLGTDERLLDLPGLPISEVHEVRVDGELLPAHQWRLATSGVYRAAGWACGRQLPEITVTYTHGLPEVPEDIAQLAVAMVKAGLKALDEDGWDLQTGARTYVRIDDYGEGYHTGADFEQVTPMTLPARTREWLAKRFGGGATVVRRL